MFNQIMAVLLTVLTIFLGVEGVIALTDSFAHGIETLALAACAAGFAIFFIWEDVLENEL